MNNKKTWTIIFSTGAKTPMKHFRLSKIVVYFMFCFLLTLIISISGLAFFLNNVANEKNDLAAKLEIKTKEIENVTQDYLALQQEALSVQRSIEEFQLFEQRLSNLNLSMPSDIEANQKDGSGGVQVPLDLYEADQISSNLLEMKAELPDLIERFEDIFARLKEYENELRTVPTIFPAAEGRISSHYGERKDPFTGRASFHTGTDVAAPLNTPIFAAADGKVIFSGRDGGYGKTVVIKHGSTYETLYAHLNRIDVEVGDTVNKGDIIGGMGTTGRSTGVHLHYEVKRNGERFDPYIYMTFHEQQ